jgi:hypothetical protein
MILPRKQGSGLLHPIGSTKWKMNNELRMRRFRVILLVLFGTLVSAFLVSELKVQAEGPLSGPEYIRKIAENVKRNRILEMSYMFEVTHQKLTLGRNAEVKDSESRTYEITPLEDDYYRKLIKKDGKSLSEQEARSEEKKLEESLKRQTNLSISERNKLEKKKMERRRKEEQFWNEVVKAFDFGEVGRETMEGRSARVFNAIPRAQYVPEDSDFELLKKIKGKIWVDVADDQVSRADVEFIEDIRLVGGLLAKVNKGGTFTVLQKKVNDEVWFPSHSEILVNGRLLLFKGFNLKIVSDFGNYRKFETSVNFVPASE